VPLVGPSPSDLGIFGGVRGWIAYGDLFGREPGIWAVDPSNPDAEPIQLDPSAGIPVAWSSDGSRMLILRPVGDPDRWGRQSHELLVLRADGTETPVAHFPGWTPTSSSGGSFTPNGSHVVYAGPDGIYSEAVDGGSPRVIYPGDGIYAPTLSPDGSRLAFFEGRGDAENRLWVMNVDGTEKREILGVDEAGRSPWSLQWSPDGTRLAFKRGHDRSFGIVDADGSSLAFVSVDIADLGPAAGPYWSPDGSRLAITRGSPRSRSVAIVQPDGTELSGFGGAVGPWNPLDPASAPEARSSPS
jgi:Tol biopolymer transport system component